MAAEVVLRERYTIRNAATHREPHEYAQRILQFAKDARFTDLRNQLDINGIDADLRRDIRRPKDSTRLDEFMSDLDEFKYDCLTYTSRHRLSGKEKAPAKRTDVGDLFANIIGHHPMAYVIVQLAQGLPHASVCVQPPGARVCLVIPDKVAFEGHD